MTSAVPGTGTTTRLETPHDREPEGTERHRNVLWTLWIMAALLVGLAWIHVYGLVEDSRARELVSAERDLSNLTRVSQEHASRTLRGADQVIRFLQAQYLELGDRLDIGALTRQGIIDTDIFNQVGIIDKNGIYAISNQPGAGRIDLSDREHFRVHLDAESNQLFVSKPVLGRASGKWSIQLTRRISKPNGEFAGVVVISIDPRYFTRFYGDLRLGSKGLSALYGLDGVARARRVGDTDEYGANAAASSVFLRATGGTSSGTYTQRSVVDGVERMYYFRRIPDYPLLVISGIDMNDLLSDHKDARTGLILQAILVTVLILALATSLTRYLRQVRSESTTRRQAQVQIDARTEQLNAIFAMSPDGFVSFDRQRRVQYVNPAFASMTAASGTALEGMQEADFWQWFSAHCSPGTTLAIPTTSDDQSPDPAGAGLQRVALSIPVARMLQMDIRSSKSALVSQILYFRDVTHESEVERLKSEFLATAAHELRTPMASIYGFSEVLLQDEQDAATRKEFMGIIHNQAQLMVGILDELLDLARIEARQGKDFHYTRVCVQDLIRDLIRSFQHAPDRSPPELRAPQTPVYVIADTGKLRQALLNVLVNAYKFSSAGGAVSLEVEVLQPDAARPKVHIHIQDQGIGMTPEQVQKVCNRFYRGDPSGKVSGAGLGMSIVKEIVELLHGEVSITSILGTGTRVSISLPVQSDPPKEPALP